MGHRDIFAAAAGKDTETTPMSVDAELTDVLGRARDEQPDLLLSAEKEAEFVRHLGRSLPAGADAGEWLKGLFSGEFLLCWAAAQGEDVALRILVEQYVKPACRVAAGSPERWDELITNITSRLFVSSGSIPPRIESYAGRAPLGAWLRVVAKRGAIDILRGEKPRLAEAEAFAQSALKVIDPELDFLKYRYARQFNEALEEVLSGLSTEDANLLYLTSVEQVSSDSVAQMRRVSRRTVQRRLSVIREEVLVELRLRMRERLGASHDEIESLLGLVQSQLGVTLHRVLARPGAPPNRGSSQ